MAMVDYLGNENVIFVAQNMMHGKYLFSKSSYKSLLSKNVIMTQVLISNLNVYHIIDYHF